MISTDEHQSSGDEILHDDGLRAHHKRLFTSLVIPVILFFTIFLVWAHWRFDTKLYLGLGVILFLDVFNVGLSIRNWNFKTPFGLIETRSDGFDCFRWVITLVGDLFVMWSLEVSPAVFLCTWVIVSFGAMAEVYRQKVRAITMSVALACFLVGIFTLFVPERVSVLEALLLTVSYASIITILWATEGWLAKEMKRSLSFNIRYGQVVNESEKIRKEAVLGNQLRTATHELSNMVSVIDMHAASLDQASSEVMGIRGAVDYIRCINRLILDDLSSRARLGDSDHNRLYSLDALAGDISLLAAKNVQKKGIAFDLSMVGGEGLFCFMERAGSTYLIVHNLIKNAVEAIEEKHGKLNAPVLSDALNGDLSEGADRPRTPSYEEILASFDQTDAKKEGGKIEVSLAAREGRAYIGIKDNGVGMDKPMVDGILKNDVVSRKDGGHGLGLIFTMNEISRNGFEISVESEVGIGTTVTISLPLSSEEQQAV